VRKKPPPRSTASDFYAGANNDGCFYGSRIPQAVGDLVNLLAIKPLQKIKCNTIVIWQRWMRAPKVDGLKKDQLSFSGMLL